MSTVGNTSVRLWPQRPRFDSLTSSPARLPDLYFDSFSYSVAPIVSSAGALCNSSVYYLLSQSQTLFGKLQAFSLYFYVLMYVLSQCF